MAITAIPKDPAALSYFAQRKAVGILALALPFVLMIGNMVFTRIGSTANWPMPLFQGSISAYYYTCMGPFLTGALCAIAMFLMCCRGYDKQDEIFGYIASGFAIGVAFCPTAPVSGTVTPLANRLSLAHEIFAALLFLVLSYFCLFLFTKTSGNPTRRKRQRNIVYYICGAIMVFSMIVMTSLHIKAVGEFFQHINMLLIFETVCLLAFGAAWLTKGEAILKDDEALQSGSAAVAGKAEEQGVTV